MALGKRVSVSKSHNWVAGICLRVSGRREVTANWDVGDHSLDCKSNRRNQLPTALTRILRRAFCAHSCLLKNNRRHIRTLDLVTVPATGPFCIQFSVDIPFSVYIDFNLLFLFLFRFISITIILCFCYCYCYRSCSYSCPCSILVVISVLLLFVFFLPVLFHSCFLFMLLLVFLLTLLFLFLLVLLLLLFLLHFLSFLDR